MLGFRWDVFGFAVCALAVVLNVVAVVMNVPVIPERPVFRSLLVTLNVGCLVLMVVFARRHWRRIQEHRQARRMNVRVVRAGEELPARLLHLGVCDGLDVWVVIQPDVMPGDTLRVAVLPGHTAVVGGFAGNEGL